MNKYVIFAAAGLLAFSLSACAGVQENPKTAVGTVIGAGAGAVVGAQFGSGSGQLAATAVGTLLGAVVGQEVGRSLDRADRMYMERSMNRASAAPLGEPVVWNNPNSGNYGQVTAVRDGYTQTGRYCREYQTRVTVGGREQVAYGVACQQADGQWEIQ